MGDVGDVACCCGTTLAFPRTGKRSHFSRAHVERELCPGFQTVESPVWLVFIDIDGFWCIPARAENTRLNLFKYARNHVVRMGGAVQIGHGAEALAAAFIK